MSIAIAPISERHIAGFHACLDAVAREKSYLAQLEAMPLERVTTFVRDNIAADGIQFVALDGDRVIGWADILRGWAHAIEHRGSLGIGVLSHYRGMGIGERLLRACLEKARAKGLTRVELEVRMDNQRAIRLYERLGFVREAVKHQGMRFEGVYYDSLQMCLLMR
jgi:ribosomal protein S18 acetylase RimI-like enzyme